MTPPRNGTWALGAVVTIALATSTVAVASRFLPDDPIVTDPESHDASRVKPRTSMASMSADVTRWLESRGRSRGQGPIRAMNVNTIDEVPDSSWFTNRPPDPGRLTVEVPDDGENRVDRTREDSANRWTITAAEGTQRLVRLNVRDTLGVGHVLTFEAPAHAERTTGATMLTVTLLGAAGYNAPTHHLIRVKRGQLAIDPIALVSDQFGHRRRMTTTDLGLLLARTARHTDGSYRVVARRQPDGVDLGPFTYAGTRRDDPNDLFPHEHHRELRGLKVFAAWLNHDAPAAFGTRDVLVDANGRQLVRHWLVELGATLGSGSALAERAPAGNEDAWRNRPKLRTLLTLGLAVRPWVKVPYPDLPSVGQFEATFFDPSSWIPPYSNAAFDNARADDLFWAARRVASFSNSAIRAAVQAGQYSDPAAEAFLVGALIARRDKIATAWLNGVLPLVDCQLVTDGWLDCTNAAERATRDQLATTPLRDAGRYQARWFRFDNATDGRSPVAGAPEWTAVPRFAMPAGLLETREMIGVEIRGEHPRFAGWSTPMTLYFRRTSDGWKTVGIDRMP